MTHSFGQPPAQVTTEDGRSFFQRYGFVDADTHEAEGFEVHLMARLVQQDTTAAAASSGAPDSANEAGVSAKPAAAAAANGTDVKAAVSPATRSSGSGIGGTPGGNGTGEEPHTESGMQ